MSLNICSPDIARWETWPMQLEQVAGLDLTILPYGGKTIGDFAWN